MRPLRAAGGRAWVGRSAGALALVLISVVAAPAGVAEAAPPPLDARAALVIDSRDGHVLLARGASERRPVASATKLMTALVVLERADPEDVFTAGSYIAQPIESRIDLRPGERMKVRDLLRALLLESANDAAVTLAENVAGSRPRFVALMNRRARRLGLRATHFANPIGLDDPGNYSTARDLGRLARHLMGLARFRAVVDLPRARLRSGARERAIDNRNRLVRRVRWIDGIKTGHTRGAGYVLVGSGARRGAAVISVVLGEPSEAARDRDTLALLRWGIGSFRRVTPVRAQAPVARVPIEHGDGRRVALVSRTSMTLTARRDQRVSRRVSAPRQLTGPLPAGTRVGSVRVLLAGRTVRRSALLTAVAVPEPPLVDRLLTGAVARLTWLVPLAMVLGTMLLGLRIRGRRRRGLARRRTPA